MARHPRLPPRPPEPFARRSGCAILATALLVPIASILSPKRTQELSRVKQTSEYRRRFQFEVHTAQVGGSWQDKVDRITISYYWTLHKLS